MEQIAGQLSFFELMDGGELRPEEKHSNVLEPWGFHVGVKGWMMHAYWFDERPHVPEWLWGCVVVYTDRWVSTKEPRQTEYGWSTAGEKVRMPGDNPEGWYGGTRPLWRVTPTFDERLDYAMQVHGKKHPRRVIDADNVVALYGPPLNEAEKDTIRKLRFR